MRQSVCKVTVNDHKFDAYCNHCERLLATFSQHESAMNWAQAHAWGSKHIWRREVK